MLVRALQRLENAAPRVPFSSSPPASLLLRASSLRAGKRARSAGAGANVNCCSFSTADGRPQFHRSKTLPPVHNPRLRSKPAKCSPSEIYYPPLLVGGQLPEGRHSRLPLSSSVGSTRGYATAAEGADGSGKSRKRGRPRKKAAATGDENTGDAPGDIETASRKRKSKKLKEKEAKESSRPLDIRRNDALLAALAEVIVHHPSVSTAQQNYIPKKRRARKPRQDKEATGDDARLAAIPDSNSQTVCEADLRRTHALIATLYDVLSYRPSKRIRRGNQDTPTTPTTTVTAEDETIRGTSSYDIQRTNAFIFTLYHVLSNRTKPQTIGCDGECETASQSNSNERTHKDLESDIRRHDALLADIRSAISESSSHPPSFSRLSSSTGQLRRQKNQPADSSKPAQHALSFSSADMRQNESAINTHHSDISDKSLDSPLISTDCSHIPSVTQRGTSQPRHYPDVMQNDVLINSIQAAISQTPFEVSHNSSAHPPLKSQWNEGMGHFKQSPMPQTPAESVPNSIDEKRNLASADVRRQTAFLGNVIDALANGSRTTPAPPDQSSPSSSSSSSSSSNGFGNEDRKGPQSAAQLGDELPNDLEHILRHEHTHEYSRLWELFEQAGSPAALASRILAHQCHSYQPDDILRCMYLFETIHNPSELDYLNITRALLKDEKGSIAGGSAKIVDICREALQNGKADQCFHTAFFVHVTRKDWSTASRIYRYKPERIGTKGQLQLLWQHHQTEMVKVPERILDIIHGIKMHELALVNFLEPLTNFLVFSVVSSKQSMGVMPMDMTLSIFDGLWDLSILDIRHYYWAFATLQQIDRSEGTARSMLLYRSYRERFPRVKVPETTMMGFFVTLSRLNISHGIYTLLSDSRRFYGKPPYHSYLHAVKIFSRQGKIEDVERLLDMYIRDHGRPTNLEIVTPLINAYGILGKVDEVKKQIDKIREDYHLTPDTAIWNILLKAHSVNDDILGAFWVVEHMLESGVQADVRTFTTLLNILARRRDITTLLDVFEKFKELNIDVDRPLLKPVVSALCEDERYVAAEALAERITKLDLEGSPTPVWNVLLSKYAAVMDTHSLTRVHKKMLSLGVVPDSMTYGVLMLALTMTGNTNSAVLILERLHRSRRLHATEFHYAIILGGYLRERNRDMVYVIYKEIEERFGQPGPSANLTVLKSRIARDLQIYSEQGHYESGQGLVLAHAEQFLDAIMAQSSIEDIVSNTPQPGMNRQSTRTSYPHLFYENLMESYARHGALDKVAEIFEKLKEKQHHLRSYDVHTTPNTFRVLMLAYLRAGNHEAVASCWRSVFEGVKVLSTPAPKSPSNAAQVIIPAFKFSLSYCISLYMRSLASQGEYEQIRALISDVEAAGFGLTTDNWSLYVKLLALSDNPEDQLLAFRYFEKLFIRNFPRWKDIVRGYAKRPRDVPPSMDLIEKRPIERGKPLNVLGKRGRRIWAKLRPDYMQPTYSAMVYLASAYLSFQARAVVDGGAELSKLGEVGPRTLMTLGDMPVLNERYQKVLLKGLSPMANAPPKEIDTQSPVWEGGILGPGGRRADTTPVELTSPDGRLVPKRDRPFIRPLMRFTSEPDEEDMLAIFEADRRWRETLRQRLTNPREPRDTEEIVRREDELDVEDERLYDIYPYNEKAFTKQQHQRRNESTYREHARTRTAPTPGGVRALEERLKRGKASFAPQ
ncbi:hypothetical protein KEM56_006899 [Ascosphaera pollenicola]|nr:hypothetical protein KEM56_006899 [Ascosphaera pollenicola]